MEVLRYWFKAYNGEMVKTFEHVFLLPNNEVMIDLDGSGVYDICDRDEFEITLVVEFKDGSVKEYVTP